MQGVQVVGVGGDEEVGAGAGFDLEAENLGAGKVADDPDFKVRVLESVGGFGDGLAEGGGGEDVKFLGGCGFTGGEDGGEQQECQKFRNGPVRQGCGCGEQGCGMGGLGGGMGRVCARKSFF